MTRIGRFPDGYRRRHHMIAMHVGCWVSALWPRHWDVCGATRGDPARAGRPIAINWIATRTLDRARGATRGIDGVN